MNTTNRTTTPTPTPTMTRLASIAVAAVMTLAMLAAVDTLARADKSAPEVAQAAHTAIAART